MSRLGALFWIGLVMGSGFAMYMVKYGVQHVEGELARVQRQTVAAQLEIRVLDAEWNYLTQPERLAALNQRFLQLGPITPKQLETTIADIPLRPAPVPAAPPTEMVAAASQVP
ncbi:MAG: cell division protein FtsL, partial [Stellaceae bacterium]